jgi:hypothetical protein
MPQELYIGVVMIMFHEDETQIFLVSTSDIIWRSMDAMLLYAGDKWIAKEGNIGRGRLKIRKLPRPDVVWFGGWDLREAYRQTFGEHVPPCLVPVETPKQIKKKGSEGIVYKSLTLRCSLNKHSRVWQKRCLIVA